MPGTWRAAAFYTVLTLALAYPLSISPGRSVLADDPDTHLFMWTLSWDVHALTSQPLSIFDANIFHPARRTLAYSENLIGSAFVAAPILWLTSNPVLAMNAVALLACVLCGVGAYVLGRRAGLSAAGAMLCGVIFAFSPPRFFRTSQLHLATVQWIPFALAALHAYLDHGRKRDLRWAAALFSLQALASGHGAVFLTVAMAILLAYRAALGEPIALARRLRDLGLIGAALLIPAVLVYVPYRLVQMETGLRRGFEAFETTPESFIASPTPAHAFLLSLWTAADVNATASAYLFPGYVPLLLALAALVWARAKVAPDPTPRRHVAWTRVAGVLEIAALLAAAVAVVVAISGPIRLRVGALEVIRAREPLRAAILCALLIGARLAIASRVLDVRARLRHRSEAYRRWAAARRQDPVGLYAVLTVFCVLLVLGTTYGLWAYVYRLPGFGFVRVPSRFMVLALLGVAVLAGAGFDRLSAGFSATARRAGALAAGVLLIVEFAAMPLAVTPFTVSIPSADRFLAGRPRPFAVAEVPVTTSLRSQTAYMLHSTAHWQKTVHGYSGMRPPLHDVLYDELRTFPDEASVGHLERLGVNYVVVHQDLFPPEEWPAVEAALGRFGARLTLEYADGEGRVYALRRLQE